jgi:hypothetical protein
MATSEAQLASIDRYTAKYKAAGVRRLSIGMTQELRDKLDPICEAKGIVHDRGAQVGEPNYVKALILLAEVAMEAGLEGRIKN